MAQSLKEKRKDVLRYLLSICFLSGMFGMSELLQEKEIIFPEIMAILIGGIITKRQIWNVSKNRMVAVMTVSAFVGWGISRWGGIFLYGKVLTALAFALLLLMVSKTSIVPLLSACILPVMIGTTSVIYPISVFVMTLMIALLQLLLERWNLKEKREYQPQEESVTMNLKRFIVLAVFLLLPLTKGFFYLAVPPLLVVFMELSRPMHPLAGRKWDMTVIVGMAAILGVAGRGVLNENLGVPMFLSVTVVGGVLLWGMQRKNLLFPPAGAIALLPFILPLKGLVWYPAEVLLGLLVLLGAKELVQLDWLKIPQPEREV